LVDATLLKSDGFPTYHLAVVVDDHAMNITHILRGHDWMPSTPIHLLVYKYLGYEVPHIGHMTDILDPEGGKLSKRKGSVSCEALIKEGYLPEALLNCVMLLGWAPKDNRELFSLSEFVEAFDPKGFQKANPVFNRDKLDWFNGEYIRQLSDEELVVKFVNQNPKYKEMDKEKQLAIAVLLKERIKKLSDINTLAGFFFEVPKVDKQFLGEKYKEHLSDASQVIENLDSWSLDVLNEALILVVKEKGYITGDFFMDLRVAVAGSRFTPPINDSIIILGKEETLTRLNEVI
jgi:glutamyl-tRNA synthetase